MRRLALIVALLAVAPAARADEGMWTYDEFPSAQLQKKYGFTPSEKWLEQARLGSVRLAEGCSGSIVSPNGLVMTNHHCAHSCIEQLSTAQRDYVATGFWARTVAEEVKCPEIEVNQLVQITDVTPQVQKATAGKTGAAFASAQQAAFSELSGACATSADVRCDVVTLYHGGKYALYKYRRFQDVRLVFAPEFAIAFFGGDPDNFNFPRYDLDVSFLRIYDQGKPAKLDTYFGWNAQGPKDGELQFVSGHPGRTERLDTVAELEFQRDAELPMMAMYLAEYRGMLEEFAARSPEDARISNAELFYTENSLKVYRGLLGALRDPALLKKKAADEKALRGKVGGKSWDEIAKSMDALRTFYTRLYLLEAHRPGYLDSSPLGFQSTLFLRARQLVRAAEELPKPDAQRLEEFTEADVPALKQELGSTAPIYDALEIEELTYSLTKLREELGPDDALVKKVLGKLSPRELATQLVKGSQELKDPQARLRLLAAGQKGIETSKDPMIALAKLIDPEARAVRQQWKEQVHAVTDRAHGEIARAQFKAYGTKVYPDATFTLRLSFGTVKGWPRQDGVFVKPFTNFAGAFERATGSDPFRLPDSWLKAKQAGKLNLETPFNYVTDNDIVGGNSGSPAFDKDLRITGLVFDGNIDSIGGDFGFDDRVNRAVMVDSAALLEALSKIYGAQRIVDEITSAPPHKI